VTVTATDCTGSTTTSFTYDALNRLTQVSKTGLATQSYLYDDQGRRISKTVGGVVTNWVYNGLDIASQYEGTWTTPTTVFTHGPRMDEPLIQATSTTAQYYHQDGLGNVVALTNPDGTAAALALYDVWGNTLGSAGTLPLYGYTGREPDETGLIYYRARYYDPTLGRFTQRDPIGMQGGMNLYAYVGNNPVAFADPSGLLPQDSGLRLFADASQSYAGNTAIDAPITSGTQRLSPSQRLAELGHAGLGGLLIGTGALLSETGIGAVFGIPLAIYGFDYMQGHGNAALTGEPPRTAVGSLIGEDVNSMVAAGAFAAGNLGLAARSPGAASPTGSAATGTVWDSVRATQPPISGTLIPQSFVLSAGESQVWIAPNATRHIAEVTRFHGGSPLATQMVLSEFRGAVTGAIQQGIVYDKMQQVGRWELMFGAPRVQGDLPALYHAVPKY